MKKKIERLERSPVRVEIPCAQCGTTVSKYPYQVKDVIDSFCGKSCAASHRNIQRKLKNLTTVPCSHCGETLTRTPWYLKTNKNHFCNKSCAAHFRNANKTKGYRRSKLELWLESQLNILFPNLKIKYNSKEEIKSELDIFIPSLSLAFELNGIFHYEAIYGKETLHQVQNNDERKFQACLENQIELCIIDSSGQKYFTEKSSEKYLDIIVSLINRKLNLSDFTLN